MTMTNPVSLAHGAHTQDGDGAGRYRLLRIGRRGMQRLRTTRNSVV